MFPSLYIMVLKRRDMIIAPYIKKKERLMKMRIGEAFDRESVLNFGYADTVA